MLKACFTVKRINESTYLAILHCLTQLDSKHFKLVQALTLHFTRKRVGNTNNNRKNKLIEFGTEMQSATAWQMRHLWETK